MCVFLLFKNYIMKAIYVKHLIRERFSPNVNITYNTLYIKIGEKIHISAKYYSWFGLSDMWGL